jgi:hypothetical protein
VRLRHRFKFDGASMAQIEFAPPSIGAHVEVMAAQHRHRFYNDGAPMAQWRTKGEAPDLPTANKKNSFANCMS